MNRPPLEGITVLDLSRVLAGRRAAPAGGEPAAGDPVTAATSPRPVGRKEIPNAR
jgi:hypothetical protein